METFDTHFDRAGQAIDFMTWARLFEDLNYRIIFHNHFPNFFLSTVWLGMDHNFSFSGDPIIFETMIFYNDEAGPMWRYSTEEEARRHNRTLLLIMQETVLKKLRSKKWNRREQKKLLYKLYGAEEWQ